MSHMVTDSSLDDEHFIREAAVALCAAEALLLHDSSSVENAVAWSRDLFAAIDTDPMWAAGRHDGDCTKHAHTCARCVVEDFIATARKEHDDDD